MVACSHSGSQFRPHAPKHWKPIIPPPHCAQTRLRREEIRFGLSSLGFAAKFFTIPPLSVGSRVEVRGAVGGLRRNFHIRLARPSDPCWLAAEFVVRPAAPSPSRDAATVRPMCEDRANATKSILQVTIPSHPINSFPMHGARVGRVRSQPGASIRHRSKSSPALPTATPDDGHCPP